MKSKSDTFLANVQDGIDKVAEGDGNYAFIYESSLFDYVTVQNCDLVQIGVPFNEWLFAIGLKESKLKESWWNFHEHFAESK